MIVYNKYLSFFIFQSIYVMNHNNQLFSYFSVVSEKWTWSSFINKCLENVVDRFKMVFIIKANDSNVIDKQIFLFFLCRFIIVMIYLSNIFQ